MAISLVLQSVVGMSEPEQEHPIRVAKTLP